MLEHQSRVKEPFNVKKLTYRHEIKHTIHYADSIVLTNRLKTVADFDHFGIDGTYMVNSLYFDNYQNKVLREKLDGVCIREKFRLRYYNQDLSLIRLEKKSKHISLCNKQSAIVTYPQCQRILQGDIDWMLESKEPLIIELYHKMKSQLLKPKTIISYVRQAFFYPAGNVRITLDRELKTGGYCTDFLSPNALKLSIQHPQTMILEVKYDEFLPELIQDIIQLQNRRHTAFSKYAAGRCFG